jgi:hypothetical protein
MFCYEYGYLCFEVMVLTIQVAMLTRLYSGGFDTFMINARKCTHPRQLPTLLAIHTVLQIRICAQDPTNKGMSWVLQTSPIANGGRVFLPAVGGLTNLDGLFLLKTLWESRKQFSFIGSKAATPGWSFIIQILGEHLLNDFQSGKLVLFYCSLKKLPLTELQARARHVGLSRNHVPSLWTRRK